MNREFLRLGKIQRCSTPSLKEDRISYLPDEILVCMLSRLDVVEQQAKTSILARRWATLWRYSTSLRFVSSDRSISGSREFIARVNRKFVSRVNHITDSLLATSIEDFTVIFRLQVTEFQHDIDGWVKLALQKRVKRLKLDLSTPWLVSNYYSLTTEAICNHHTVSLTCVSLCGVDVTGDFLEYLLSVSPFLEELSVFFSPTLVNFTVTGHSLKLKHLEITLCLNLSHVHIYDVNLVSFKYDGQPSFVTIKDTPCLVKAELNKFLLHNQPENDALLLSHLPLLQTLIVSPALARNARPLPKFPMLMHLKLLEFVMTPDMMCWLSCAHLLEASPLLVELKVKFRFFKDNSKGEMVQGVDHQNTCLKVVKFSGFIGCRLDMAIALYFIERAVALEKVIIDTNNPYKKTREIDPDKQDSARTLAREQLLVRIPPRVQMIVI